MISFKDVSLEDAVDKLLDLKDKLTCAQIDAGACQTEMDYKKKHRAEQTYEEAREAFAPTFDMTLMGK